MMQAIPGALFLVGHEGSVPVHNPVTCSRQDSSHWSQHVRAHH